MTWEARADLVIVGTGVAGLSAALRARELGLRVLVVTKDAPDAGSTCWAQGGIAVVRGALAGEHLLAGDSVDRHVADTLAAGAGLSSGAAARELLSDGAAAIDRLRARGARFDPDERGGLSRTREGGHGAFRVIHSGGDATGVEVQRSLSRAAGEHGVPVLERHCAADVLRGADGAVAGALVLDADGNPGVLRAPAVLLASGGLGQLYARTTNPDVATGDGVALALRAGAAVADLEFVQFHPTVLRTGRDGRGRRPLITEAVRGEGAVLVDADGNRVMDGEHPQGDLAPRDVVSAAIDRCARESGGVYLDSTGIGTGFAERFPTVFETCRRAGIDPVREPIPVTTAAHYACGGVMTTVDGRAGVAGLYAAGEVACTGLHGANRLASNSLLEGLVLGHRAAESAARDVRSGALGRPVPGSAEVPALATVEREVVQRTMSRAAGFRRTEAGLTAASRELEQAGIVRPLRTREAVEDSSVALTAQAVLAAARTRAESRGCHRRADRPDADDAWCRNVVLRLDVSGWLIRTDAAPVRRAA